MASNNDRMMIFPMGLKFDPAEFEKMWLEAEKKIQRIINRSKFHIRVDIDQQAIRNTVDALEKIRELQTATMAKSSPAAMIKAKGMAEAKAVESQIVAEAKAKKILATINTEVQRSEQMLATERRRTVKEGKLAEKAEQTLVKERGYAAKATRDAMTAEERLKQAKMRTAKMTATQNVETQRHSRSLISQMGIMNGIPQLLTSYVSVLGASRLATNIREVTAEFELQRVALAAIIQDKPKADQLFAQMVELGIQSPFQIKELITYTKQLAAYRIETENLYDTTKRLADISAGLGVDMSRLILAYGQVRAASVLRGQELRQFTEAGIPLVDLLAKKFTVLRGELVSTGDVFKLISDRAVPFSMIKEIFEDMTNAGGTFYNMQAIQARTLRGVWSNLRDAYDKMFMEMGNANMGLLKGLGNTLRKVAENWETVFSVISKGVIVYGIYRAAVTATTVAQGKLLSANLAEIMAAKKKEAVLLSQSAVYRKLTGAEAARLWTVDRLTKKDLIQLTTSGKLTKDMALRMIVLKKLNVEQQKQLVTMGFLTQAEVNYARSAKLSQLLWVTATTKIKMFTASIKASTAALLSNPYTWIIVALTGIVTVITKLIARNKEFNELTKKVTVGARDYAEQLNDSYKKVSDTIRKGLDVNADSKSIQLAITALKEVLNKNESIKPLVAERLRNVTDEVKQLKILKKTYDELLTVMENSNWSNYLPKAVKATGGIFNNDLVDNMEKVNKQIAGINDKLFDMRAEGRNVSSVQNEFQTLVDQFRTGTVSVDEFSTRLKEVWRSSDVSVRSRLYQSFTELGLAAVQVSDDSEKAFNLIKAQFTKIGNETIDFTNKDRWGLTDDNYEALRTRLAGMGEIFVQAMEDIDRATFKGLYGRAFQIPFKPVDPDPKDLSKLEKAFNTYVLNRQKQGKLLKVGTYSVSSEERDVVAEVNNQYEKSVKALEDLNRLKKLGQEVSKEDMDSTQQEIKDWEELLTILGEADKLKKGQKGKDPRVESLEKEVSLVKEAYAKFQEYSKLRGTIAAQSKVREMYKDKFDIPGIGLAFDQDSLNTMFNKALSLYKTYGEGAAEAYFKTWNDQADAAFKDMSETTKDELSKIGADISKIQKANNFYDEMLDITGDAELSKKIVLQITGLETGDVAAKLKEQLQKAAQEYGVEVPLVAGQVDVASFVAALEDAFLDGRIGVEGKKVLDDYLAAFIGNEQEQIKQLYAGLAKYETYENKRAKIIAEGQALMTLAIKKGSQDQIAASQNYMDTQLADLEYENFKTSDMYADMFGDLNNLSVEALTNIRTKVIELSQTIGSKLSPSNMKEIVSKIDDINKKLIEINPFEAWRESLKETAILKGQIDALSETIDAGVVAGLDPVDLIFLRAQLDLLQKDLSKTENSSQMAFNEVVKHLDTVYSSAKEVASGVREIFEEFGVGEDTIAIKSLNLIESIGSGVMKVLQTTANVAAQSISTVEKASIILTIISVVLQVAMKIYSLFSNEARLTKQIEALSKDVEYLQKMYDRLDVKTVTDPAVLRRLQQELTLRKEMLSITEKQMALEVPGLKENIKDNLLLSLGLNLVSKNTDMFNRGAFALTAGFNYLMRALVSYGKLKKYNEYIEEANERLDYQSELYDIIYSDMNSIAKSAKARVANLQEQNRLIQKQIDAQVELGRKMDVDKLLELQEKLAKNQADISYAFLDALYDATGDIFKNLADGITSALTQAFENGESSALAFEKTIDDVMRNVVIDLWKANVLPAMLQPVMGQIYAALGLGPDGKVKQGSTPDYFIDAKEAAAIAGEANKSKKDILASFSGLESIFEIFGAGNKNLTGIAKAVGTMSEESALTLASIGNSMLYYNVGMYNIQTKMLAIMEAYSTVTKGKGDANSDMAKLYAIQTSALSELTAIKRNTELTASNTGALVDALQKLTVSGGKNLNVKLIN